MPWNYPFEVSSQKIGQALATGNTMILKPAPDTPWNATRLGRLIAEKTDIPAGVLHVVTSSDHLVGEELTTSPLVDLISFTGSTVTGKRIFEKGGATMKRLFLELGGKSADIVLDDADLESKMAHGVDGVRARRSGLRDADADAGRAFDLRPGDRDRHAGLRELPVRRPDRRRQPHGAAVSAKQRDRVLGYIEKGKDEGARVVAGGGRPEQFDKGWFVQPTLFADVDQRR